MLKREQHAHERLVEVARAIIALYARTDERAEDQLSGADVVEELGLLEGRARTALKAAGQRE